jgi:hypothetical protein
MSYPLAMMGTMFHPNGSSIECGTCVAADTSACSDCIVNYVLANDAGPVEFVPVHVGPHDERVDATVRLFVRAGLVDDPVVFLSSREFERGVVVSPHHPSRAGAR